jgi:hypothetical protein
MKNLPFFYKGYNYQLRINIFLSFDNRRVKKSPLILWVKPSELRGVEGNLCVNPTKFIAVSPLTVSLN